VVLLVKVFVLNRVPEKIPGAADLGIAFEGVLASILASYAFYLIVVHGKERRDKAAVSPHISKWARRIVGGCRNQLGAFSNATDIPLDLSALTKQNVETVFSKVSPHANAPLVFAHNQHANWLQFLDYHRVRDEEHIRKIFSLLIFVDSQLASLLTAIDDCSHYSAVRLFVGIPIKNEDLSAFAGEFYNYCVACRNLEQYLNDREGEP
jgi:hypothetical protein